MRTLLITHKLMFFITVSNGLLEEKHYQKMGASVWQFMWLIDKVTKIDDDGNGWVLGGKPIKLDDIPVGSRNTNSRNLQNLEREGYIKLIHTPYGLSIRVLKAQKRFTKNETRITKSGEPKRLPNNGEPNIRHNSLDTTVTKKEYGEFENVKLTDEQYQKLIEQIGENNLQVLIGDLSRYLENLGDKGKRKYASHYATIQTWARRKVEKYQEKIADKKVRTIA